MSKSRSIIIFKDASVEEVLSAMLDKGLSYSIQGKMIVISQKTTKASSPQQQKKVTGVVKDKTGESGDRG